MNYNEDLRQQLIKENLIHEDKYPNENLIGKPCAACGRLSEGYSTIHRDGFGEGPEVPLCNHCGLHEYPSCSELWNKIYDLALYLDDGELDKNHPPLEYFDFGKMDLKNVAMSSSDDVGDDSEANEEESNTGQSGQILTTGKVTNVNANWATIIWSWPVSPSTGNITYYPLGGWGSPDPVPFALTENQNESKEEKKEIRYGATCTKCNEIYEHAEWRENFVCYPCRVEF